MKPLESQAFEQSTEIMKNFTMWRPRKIAVFGAALFSLLWCLLHLYLSDSLAHFLIMSTWLPLLLFSNLYHHQLSKIELRKEALAIRYFYGEKVIPYSDIRSLSIKTAQMPKLKTRIYQLEDAQVLELRYDTFESLELYLNNPETAMAAIEGEIASFEK